MTRAPQKKRLGDWGIGRLIQSPNRPIAQSLLFLLSVLARSLPLGRYVTPDEPTWVYRSIQFREALLSGNWAGTLVAGHPGVTTTWLGALGMSVQLALSDGARAAYDWLTTLAFLTPDNVEAMRRLAVLLSGGRLAVILVNSLGVVAAYGLARRLWGDRVALVAGLLLALDPFFAGLSGLLHVDGLSATFVTLSLLALLVALQASAARRWRWAALAGGLAGLAVLSKTPTLVLLPVSGLMLLSPLAFDHGVTMRVRLLGLLRDGLVWGVAFGLVVLLLYPALWVAPGAVLATLSGSANRHLDEALRETFFLGRAAFNHGPLFYPVVLLWRLSPVVWLAVAVVVGRFAKSLYRGTRGRRGAGEKGRKGEGENWIATVSVAEPATRHLPLATLLLWLILFTAAITPAAKKFDRYILPVVPAALLLSAVVWGGWSARPGRLGRWVLPLIVIIHGLYWLVFAAYPLAAYNPLVGGPFTAVRVLPIGWGESISAAGRWLTDTEPEAAAARAMAGVAPSLAPFFAGQTLVAGQDDPTTADFTIITLGGQQLDPAGVAAQVAGQEQIYTAPYGGLDGAWVYRRADPQPPAAPPVLPAPVSFGDRIALTAVSQAADDDGVSLLAQWRRLLSAADSGRYTLRIVIRDDVGNAWATQETPLLNEVYFYPPDWASADTNVVRYRLELPPGIPPSTYTIALTLVDDATAGQLPVRVGAEAFGGVAYGVGQVEVAPPEVVIAASRLQLPNAEGAIRLDGQLQLLGFGDVPDAALAGSRLPIDLFWHAPDGEPPAGLQVAWHLVAADGADRVIAVEPLSRYDTGLWRIGETIQEKYRLPLPPDLPPGNFQLRVEPLLAQGGSVGAPIALADLRIDNINRQYEAVVPVPYGVSFGALDLLGLNTNEVIAAPGEAPELSLFWEKSAPFGAVFTVFVHLIDAAGNIVQNADHWPGGLPTDVLDGGQIVTDRFPIPLPADLPPGEYRVKVGLYSAENGLRLPARALGDEGTGQVGSDFVILPLRFQVVAP